MTWLTGSGNKQASFRSMCDSSFIQQTGDNITSRPWVQLKYVINLMCTMMFNNVEQFSWVWLIVEPQESLHGHTIYIHTATCVDTWEFLKGIQLLFSTPLPLFPAILGFQTGDLPDISPHLYGYYHHRHFSVTFTLPAPFGSMFVFRTL